MHPVSEWSVHPAGLAVEGYLPISPMSQQPRAPVWVTADLQAVPLLPRRCTGRRCHHEGSHAFQGTFRRGLLLSKG